MGERANIQALFRNRYFFLTIRTAWYTMRHNLTSAEWFAMRKDPAMVVYPMFVQTADKVLLRRYSVPTQLPFTSCRLTNEILGVKEE